MLITKSARGRVTVVALLGDMDGATAAEVRDDLEELVPDGGRVLLDLGGMPYVSSAGLRVLLLVHHRARSRGARLALARVPVDVREVMSATGFIDAFQVVDTVDDGVAVLSR
jgi:anti-sigma B factor antagonist